MEYAEQLLHSTLVCVRDAVTNPVLSSGGKEEGTLGLADNRCLLHSVCSTAQETKAGTRQLAASKASRRNGQAKTLFSQPVARRALCRQL